MEIYELKLGGGPVRLTGRGLPRRCVTIEYVEAGDDGFYLNTKTLGLGSGSRGFFPYDTEEIRIGRRILRLRDVNKDEISFLLV